MMMIVMMVLAAVAFR